MQADHNRRTALPPTIEETSGPADATAAGSPAASPRAGWAALVVVLAATFVSTLDFFIVNVDIPSTGVITAGRLGDLAGRRRMFALGLALFTASSAACGLAPSANALVAARVAQGLAAAAMTPQVLASASYVGRALGRAFAAYGLTMGLAGVSGQLIGGALIQADPFGLPAAIRPEPRPGRQIAGGRQLRQAARRRAPARAVGCRASTRLRRQSGARSSSWNARLDAGPPGLSEGHDSIRTGFRFRESDSGRAIQASASGERLRGAA